MTPLQSLLSKHVRTALACVVIRNQHMQSAIKKITALSVISNASDDGSHRCCGRCGSILKFLIRNHGLSICATCRHSQRRAAEFQKEVAPILVPFIYGPDYYGYIHSTDFVMLSNGILHERNILVRVVDESLYPPEWKQFMRWKEQFGLCEIAPHTIVEDYEDCA